MRKLRAADLFCGAGGTSQGAEDSGGAEVVFALNHWEMAVRTHSANFPRARHVNSRIEQTSPGEAERLDLLFASPECTHHSRARGGRPTSDQQRSGAWHVLPWIEFHRPSYVVIENVVEFRDWGPVNGQGQPLKSKRGETFYAWLRAIQSLGYRIEHREMNAADYGAATSRNRLFVIARKGNRAPRFPDPTHNRRGLGGVPWRAAYEVIDWTIPCPSIFARTPPLADKTLSRIEAGLRRFVEPFLVLFRNNMNAASLGDPLSTVTASGGHHGIAIPFQYQLIGLGAGRSRNADSPVPTQLATRENHGICVPFVSRFNNGPDGDRRNYGPDVPLSVIDTSNRCGVAVPYIVSTNHGDTRHTAGRTADPGETLGTITSHNGRGVAVPFLCSHYSSGGQWQGVDQPVRTIPTVDRHALTVAIVEPLCLQWPEPHSEAMRALQSTMRELHVADVGFRMLQNPELAAAQGFPESYIFHGNKADVTRQIGNSVSPPVANAITRMLLSA